MRHTLIAMIAATAFATPALAENQEPTPEVGYHKGFFIHGADGVNKLTIQGRVQARFQYEQPDEGN